MNQSTNQGCFILVLLCCFFCWEVVSGVDSAKRENDRPIVGLLTQPTSSDPPLQPYGKNYLPASYVKWIESAGARVVPFPYDADTSYLKHLFSSVNGLLLPGGDVDLDRSPYETVTATLYSWAVEANNKGDYFPIWGTCQGFEQLAVLGAGSNYSVLSHFSAENLSLPLTFTRAARTSALFGSLPAHVYETFQSKPITENLHELGVSPAVFEANKVLSSSYTVLSTNLDRNGNEFISSFAAKHFPFYGVQFHPERNCFEWDPKEAINHSGEAVEAMQALARFFVSEVRKNFHSFPSAEAEQKALIYNSPPLYSGHITRYYEQIYFYN